MTEIRLLFAEKKVIVARALFVGERLQLRALETTNRLATAPLTVSAGERGCAVLFRYGAVVLFDLAPLEEATFLASLRPFIQEPLTTPEQESVEIHFEAARDERVENGVAYLKIATVDRLQTVADILAKSVVLDHHEASVANAFDRIEPLAASLESRAAGARPRDLLRHMGRTLLIQHKMVGRVAVEEKPEILWEHPELERLYLRLEDEYELHERHVALDRKLELISRTAETLLELLQAKSSLRVEWYIVVLIVIEILLTLYELFVP